jgi:EAL domain-containing protein (putative c-di-GMP-specific phosphodiesterase class I)
VELGIGCIVEGVETAEQLQALRRHPHLYVQGYLFDRPQAVARFVRRDGAHP